MKFFISNEKLRIKNGNKVFIGNLNINSLPNKFDQLKELILKFVDILVITETKSEGTFLTSQFLVGGFSEPFTLDRNKNRGSSMIFFPEDLPNKLQ